jgi:hypothetical protein
MKGVIDSIRTCFGLQRNADRVLFNGNLVSSDWRCLMLLRCELGDARQVFPSEQVYQIGRATDRWRSKRSHIM